MAWNQPLHVECGVSVCSVGGVCVCVCVSVCVCAWVCVRTCAVDMASRIPLCAIMKTDRRVQINVERFGSMLGITGSTHVYNMYLDCTQSIVPDENDCMLTLQKSTWHCFLYHSQGSWPSFFLSFCPSVSRFTGALGCCPVFLAIVLLQPEMRQLWPG